MLQGPFTDQKQAAGRLFSDYPIIWTPNPYGIHVITCCSIHVSFKYYNLENCNLIQNQIYFIVIHGKASIDCDYQYTRLFEDNCNCMHLSMSMKISLFKDKYTINISYKAIDRDIWQHTYTQEAFLGPWPARTLESGLSIVILNRKSGLQSPGRPGSQKCLLGSVIKV